MKKFKILLLNIEYLTGLRGSIPEYILKSYHYGNTTNKIKKEITNKLKEIILKENPDLICLIEIRKNQIKYVLDKNYPFYDTKTKYKNQILKNMPLVKNQGNAFFSKNRLNFKNYFLKNGIKRLVYEINLPKNIKLFLVHLSIGKKTRQKQLEEINQITKFYKNKIICGDFNIFKGFPELNTLLKQSNLEIRQNSPTFPSFNPRFPLDLFLCSKGLKIKCRVLKDIKISDHLPVILELEL